MAQTSVPVAPELRKIAALTDHQSVQLLLDIAGEYQYQALGSGSRLLLVDLPGVVTPEASNSRLLDSPLVSSYRVVSYLRDNRPSTRLEVLLKTPASVEYQKTAGGLQVRLSPVPSQPAPAPPAAPAAVSAVSSARGDRLDRIQVNHGRNPGDIQVQVLGNGALEFKAFELRDPYRLVLDIPNVTSRISQPALVPADMSPLRQVRVGKFQQGITRVVLELSAQTRFDVRRSAQGIEVQFRAEQAETPAQPVHLVPTTPVATVQLPSISERMPVAVDAVFASVRNLMSMPRVELVEAPPQAVQPAPPMATPVMQQGQIRQAAAPPQAPAAPMAKRYTGEPISINVKDADLKDFFRLIHEISGLNVILDRGVSGTLTMVLDDVPWDQALDIVLRNNQLDSVLEGNVLRIATLNTIKQEQRDMAELAKAQAETVDRITVTRSINYANASQLVPTIRKFLSPRADVISDDRTNQLIVTDIPQTIPVMDEVIKQLDKRTQQVEIEARIVAASRQFVRELGAQFGWANILGSQNIISNNPLGGATSPLQFPSSTVLGGVPIPLFSNFPAAGANVGVALTHRASDFALDLVLTAAENRGIGKTLSRPKIVTQNNTPGTISQGVQIPIQTTVNNTVSTQLTPVTLAMTVTPHITPDNSIFLEVNVTNNAIDPGIPRINGIPALDTQQANTRILVPDGSTVVFGGVIQNQNNLTIQQVPILGSIPVIGNLFKRTGISTTTNELLFFVTPKIL